MRNLRGVGFSRASALCAFVVVVIAAHKPAGAQNVTTETRPSAMSSDVRDDAALFDPEILKKAQALLEETEKATGIPTLIETVSSVGSGETVETAAARRVRQLGKEGLYVLIDKTNHKLEVLPTRRLDGVLERAQQNAIRDAFLSSFKERDFDGGLIQGARRIAADLKALKSRGRLRPRENEPSDLVTRNQIKLNLAGARLIIEGAKARSTEMKVKENIAVVDDGGHLLCFERMDGARPASGYTAITKATTAATFRRESGPLPSSPDQSSELLNLSLQIAAMASGGKLTTLHGGVPVLVDGQIIGAVGVGGGSGAQDVEVAKAGIAHFLSALEPSAERGAASEHNDEKRPSPR